MDLEYGSEIQQGRSFATAQRLVRLEAPLEASVCSISFCFWRRTTSREQRPRQTFWKTLQAQMRSSVVSCFFTPKSSDIPSPACPQRCTVRQRTFEATIIGDCVATLGWQSQIGRRKREEERR